MLRGDRPNAGTARIQALGLNANQSLAVWEQPWLEDLHHMFSVPNSAHHLGFIFITLRNSADSLPSLGVLSEFQVSGMKDSESTSRKAVDSAEHQRNAYGTRVSRVGGGRWEAEFHFLFFSVTAHCLNKSKSNLVQKSCYDFIGP